MYYVYLPIQNSEDELNVDSNVEFDSDVESDELDVDSNVEFD